jgi:hypothetical protein
VDFLSGIALRARRGKQVAAVAASRRGARAPEAPVSEPQFDPAPAPTPAPPPAAPVAEPVRLDHPETAPVHPNAASTNPSPEIPSPGLQPGHGTAPPPDAPPR